MAIRVGINGFGRIGRNIFRAIDEDEAFAGIDDIDTQTVVVFGFVADLYSALFTVIFNRITEQVQ